jgi:hypothetical protein
MLGVFLENLTVLFTKGAIHKLPQLTLRAALSGSS